jgi:ABC-type uncharacterized transport system auxiliary subunit
MRVALACSVLLATLLTACVSVEVGNGESPQTQFVLSDARATSAAPAGESRAATRSANLLLTGISADPLADGTLIAYARHPGERSVYQLSTWSERPVRRIPQLLQQRIEARGSFGTAAMLGDPVRADLLLTLAVEEIYHDVAQEPGQARLSLRATLYRRHERQQLAKRSFSASVAVPEARAAAAAGAMNQAVAEIFDQLIPWLESEAGRTTTTAKP